MRLYFEQKIHSHPLSRNIGKFGEILNRACNIANFPQIPCYIKDGAYNILWSIHNHLYPTRGIRREAFVVAALGIARGDKKVNELEDLVRRVEYVSGKKIPPRQIKNVFYATRNFLKYHRLYPLRPHKALTYEDKKLLKILRSKRF
jgi:hypothetical protein